MLRALLASLISYTLLITSFAPAALAAKNPARRINSSAKPTSSEQISRVSQEQVAVPDDAAPPRPSSVTAVSIAGPAITATKVDGFADPDGNGKAEPGNTISYSVTISNTGDMPATGVVFNDTVDPNTTLVPGSINVSPNAVNDTYNTIGNVQISLAAPGLLSNDTDPENGALAASGGTTSTQGGNVVINANGSFTYDPPVGFTGTDTFTYTTSDPGGLTSTATATITVSGKIWFVNTNAGAPGTSPGTGRLTNPFKTLAAFNTANTGTGNNPAAGENIFLYESATDYTGPVTLLSNQRLIGQDAAASLLTITGLTQPSGTDPLPAMNSGNGTVVNLTSSANAINAVAGNVIRGLTIGNKTGSGIAGSCALTISDASITGTGQALNLNTGTLAATFNTLSSSSGTNGVLLTSCGGSLSAAAGTLSGSTGAALSVSGGTVSATFSGGITQSNNAAAVSITGGHNTGTITFQTGTISATNGNGLQFDNADGSYNFNGTTTLNGGHAGIDILNGSSGTFSFGTGVGITNPASGSPAPAGTAFYLASSNANVTYSGSISDNTGFVVDIDNHDSGTVTFQTGTITSTAQGIRVQNSNGGTINFNSPTKTLNTGTNKAVTLDTNNSGGMVNFGNGGLNIDTTSGQGFSATGGGTISVTTGANPNTIDSTTGTALNVVNKTIGASNLTFRSISANGGTNGIVLNNTGTSGGLIVTGNSSGICGGQVTVNALGTPATITAPNVADCTGGTIQNSTGDGISLINTRNVSLTRMNISNNSANGIYGDELTNFSIISSNVTNNDAGNSVAFAAGLRFDEMYGNCAITNTTISGTKGDNVRLTPTPATTTLLTLTISGSVFGPNPAGTGGNGIAVVTHNSANAVFNITGSAFSGNQASGFLTTISDTSTVAVNISGTTFQDNNIGVDLGSSLSGVQTININTNTVVRHVGNAINIVGDGAINGTVNNNRVGNGTADSGSRDAYDIAVSHRSNLAWKLGITNNIVKNSDFEGLARLGLVQARSGLRGHARAGRHRPERHRHSGQRPLPVHRRGLQPQQRPQELRHWRPELDR